MSLLSGGVLGGVSKGFKKGLQYEVDFMRYLADAIKHKRYDELDALEAVAVEFVKEVADVSTGVIRGDIANQILAFAITGQGIDPMAGSRHKMQAVEAKFPKP